MRRYDQVHTQDLVKARAMSPPFLQGLTVWYAPASADEATDLEPDARPLASRRRVRR